MKEYKPNVGDQIKDACEKLLAMAPAFMKFNDVLVETRAGDSVNDSMRDSAQTSRTFGSLRTRDDGLSNGWERLNMGTKLTKQGVRDLSHLKAKPKGITLAEPPIVVDCKHRRKKTHWESILYWVVCEDCGETFGDGW